jgi:mono/diheme cytochrome c family protein
MTRLLVSALLLFALVIAALAAPRARNPGAGRRILPAIAEAPAKARAWKNPYDGDAEAVLAGEKLFRQHCVECHGEDARGIGRAADLRSPGVQNASPGELEWLLWNGNLPGGMPSWSGLPEQRRWQIVAYLKSLH